MENKNNNGLLDKDGNEAKVEFPITFDLKAVFDTTEKFEIQQRNLELVLEDASVSFNSIRSKNSSKGTYVSITVNVTLDDKKQMDYLYERLRLLPGIKFAV